MAFLENRCIVCGEDIPENNRALVINCCKTYEKNTDPFMRKDTYVLYYKRTVGKPRGYIHLKCWEFLVNPAEMLAKKEKILKSRKSEGRRIRIRKNGATS
jgi:hypothetical protein